MGDQKAETLSGYMKRIRRDIHKHPETAWTEYRTTALVARELERIGYQVLLGEKVLALESRSALPSPQNLELAEQRAGQEGVDPELMRCMSGGRTGAVGILKHSEGPVIALRVDMDALEVTESAEQDHQPLQQGFASCHNGICHACGHDAHTAIGLGVARLLAEDQSWRGTVKLIFQPGEEGMRGARAMIERG
ncbi:MAG: M20/M25/M40 family metallo-hydrolase, partial [Clostridium sp.]|nr:M20/M25/M40 family metallo-hydrolase [Clostridium sp.]